MNISKTIAALLAITLTTATTQASLSVGMFQPVDFPGWKVYQVFWDGGGTVDWTSAALLVDLPQGDVYNDPEAPSGGIHPAIWPPVGSSPYDTWVGAPGDNSTGVAGGASDLGGGAFSLDAPQISVAWFNTADGDTGYIQIAQFTVSNDAMGTWKVLANPGVEMLEGVIIPEPTSLALLALACPALLARRSHA